MNNFRTFSGVLSGTGTWIAGDAENACGLWISETLYDHVTGGWAPAFLGLPVSWLLPGYGGMGDRVLGRPRGHCLCLGLPLGRTDDVGVAARCSALFIVGDGSGDTCDTGSPGCHANVRRDFLGGLWQSEKSLSDDDVTANSLSPSLSEISS